MHDASDPSASSANGSNGFHGAAGDASGTTGGPSMVDWDFAVSTAQRLSRPGPDISREEARKVVAQLREFADLAEGYVRDYTGLHATAASAPVLVVDRRGWVKANADGFDDLLGPLTERMRQRRSSTGGTGNTGDTGGSGGIAGLGIGGGAGEQMAKFGSRVTALEAGAVLGYLSGRVLGQFDPFWSSTQVDPFWSSTQGGDGGQEGRLLLVAPNVVHVERELEVDPRDFRLWVCLHEETHRVQFTAVPWLRDYMRGQIGSFIEQTELDPAALLGQLREGFDQIGKVLRGGDAESFSLVDLVQTPEQREVLDRLTAMMSLLEGHADVVMDGVGPSVIPTVEHIRERFQERRKGGTFADQFLKRLLGMDKKLAQYRDGAKFVRAVVDQVGMDGFNRVWDSPQTLPGKDEIADPASWVRRVHG